MGGIDDGWLNWMGYVGYWSHGMIGTAASMTADEVTKCGRRMPNGTVKTGAKLTAESSELMDGVARGFNIAGGTIGAGVNTFKAVNESKNGENGWAFFHGSVAMSYTLGVTLTILCPECGYGEYLLITTMAADMAGEVVK